MKFKEYIDKQKKELKELPDITKKFLKQNKLKADQIEFTGMVDNAKHGKHYSFKIIDKTHKRLGKILTHIEKKI